MQGTSTRYCSIVIYPHFFCKFRSLHHNILLGHSVKANIRSYYQQFEAQQNQILLDQKIKEHLGQTATYQQVGVAFNPMRPPMPVLPTPSMPMAGNANMNSPLIPGVRPPILPRPIHGIIFV